MDTFLRILSSIEPEKFMKIFSDWIKSIVSSSGKVIAIDGKAVKSSADKIIENLALLRKICYNLIKLDDSFGNISFKKKT